MAKRVLNMVVEGRKRSGRLQKRWFDCIEDLAEKQLRVQDIADQQHWRTMTKISNPT